jgi:predicted CopG family antitoxin
VFGRKLAIEDDLYQKLKKCSEAAGYSSPEEFALHVLEKEVERILGGGGESDEEVIKKRLQGLGYID